MKQSKILILFAIGAFIISFIFALTLVPTQIVFGFDQARDAYEAYSIWHSHHLKILGPSSDVPGLNHGVLWYYFLAVIYFLGRGVPENATYILAVLLYLMVPVIAYFTYKISKDLKVTALTVALYSLSPLFISFSHWLSNPTLALFVSPVLLYLMWRYIHRQSLLLAGAVGLLYGLLIQTDFGFAILLLILPVYYYVMKIRFSLKDALAYSGGLLIGTATFFVAYIKFQTNVVSIVAGFILRTSGDSFSPGHSLIGLVDSLIKLLTFTYLPVPQLFAFFVILVLIIHRRSALFSKMGNLEKFLLIWLCGIGLIFIFNHGSLSAIFFYAPFLYPLAFLVALYILKLTQKTTILILFMLLTASLQLFISHSWSVKGNSPLSVQQGMTTNKERQVVDYTYEVAGDEAFVINTLTNPLYINTTWSYLYEMYGKPKYGSVPYFWGKDQTGYLSFLPMQTELSDHSLRFLILEPTAGIDSHWLRKTVEEEDAISDVVEEKKFGEFVVQKRILNLNKELTPTPSEKR